MLQIGERRQARLVVRLLRDANRGAMIRRREIAQRAESCGDFVEDERVAELKFRARVDDFLREPRDTESRRAPDDARIRRLLNRNDLQQAGFAAAVAADQRDALTGVDAQI